MWEAIIEINSLRRMHYDLLRFVVMALSPKSKLTSLKVRKRPPIYMTTEFLNFSQRFSNSPQFMKSLFPSSDIVDVGQEVADKVAFCIIALARL